MPERLSPEQRARLYRYGQRVCASDADADDAVQEAFMRARSFRGEAPLRRWLLTVVRNTCRRMLRPTRTRERLEHLLSVVEGVVLPDAELERQQQIASVQAAFERLDPASREILWLRELERLSGEETAQRLGISVEAMKSRLHRARLQLKAQLVVH